MKRKIDIDINSLIKDYKSGLSSLQLAKKYNIHRTTVTRLLNKNGHKPRNLSDSHKKYKIREDFFDIIDNEEKAYFLGFLYADGNLNKSRNTIEISLMQDDKEILKKFTKLIFISNKPLGYRPSKIIKNNNKTYISKPQYRLTITNKHITDVLLNLGLLENKSLILKFPTFLKKNLINHFIRGYYDGDGCISINKKTKDWSIKILGTKHFCQNIKKHIKFLSVNSSITSRGNIKSLNITGNIQIEKVISWLYENSTIFLKRKKNKAEKLLRRHF